VAKGERPVARLSHGNAAEECPDWAIPSRRWTWRIVILGCALFWGVALFWLLGGFAPAP
jgi:hypothetical protein